MELATNEQKAFLKKLEQWKDNPLDWDKVNDMSRADASALIDELKALPSVHKKKDKRVLVDIPQNAQKQPSKTRKFDVFQMGMVKKIVAQQMGYGYASRMHAEFAAKCADLYDAFEAADDLVKRCKNERE